MKTYAAVDIGTNTILMTIAKGTSPNDFEVLDDIHSIARLGEGVGKDGVISTAAFRRAEAILAEYRRIIIQHKVDKVQAVGTSAMRDAANGSDIANLFSHTLSGDVKIIQGDEEAQLNFIGTVEDDVKSAVIDIGGGSTEIVIGESANIGIRISTSLGVVRLSEKFFRHDPPLASEVEAMANFIQNELINIDFAGFYGKTYAVAGTATSLAAIDLNLKMFDRELIHNYILPFHKIDAIASQLLSMPSKNIETEYNIPPKRADVLPAGAMILKEITCAMSRDKVIVSCNGLRYGVLKQMLAGSF